MSIRLRLTLWYSTILAVTLLVFGVSLYFIASYILMDNKKDEMRQVGLEVQSQIKPVAFQVNGKWYFSSIRLPPLDQFKYPGYVMQALDTEGKVVQSTTNQVLPLTYNAEKLAAGQSSFYIYSMGGYPLLVLNMPLQYSDNGEARLAGVLQIVVSVNEISHNLYTLRLALLFLSVFVILLAASLGLYLARKALRPIENVITAAQQIENGADLGVRIEYNGPEDEIGRLTSTINSMLGRIQGAYSELEESDRAQRRFVSDASHELRTPLTTIRGNVDLLEKMWGSSASGSSSGHALTEAEKVAMSLEAMQDISGEAARMSRLVNDLLALARADAGHEMKKEPILIRDVVEEAARKAQHLPRNAVWETGDFSVLEGIGVNGSRDHLQQMLFIFIENAFKYTPEGTVRMDALVREGQVGIRIADTGIGMDKEEIPHIFERFYRADESRGVTAGTGLGLSIAKWIIDEHGGSVEVTTRLGGGSTFLVWLPVFFRDMAK
ncbi:cell wall metabolism sensor histidine kinase WalK [Paenibacillus sp. YN15]|uniref:sensor histidine kinase n=1 Tax=Paenibacillus sp. YN15 TaxID=1742774 RepID=UPI000DCBBD46|nr:HAMP domain-containing sensor histidine kinase [Paenibacillus sp. YN15]RAU91371.1 two-component sensor histidine kinase [Paenibacillus sp. YN15]